MGFEIWDTVIVEIEPEGRRSLVDCGSLLLFQWLWTMRREGDEMDFWSCLGEGPSPQRAAALNSGSRLPQSTVFDN